MPVHSKHLRQVKRNHPRHLPESTYTCSCFNSSKSYQTTLSLLDVWVNSSAHNLERGAETVIRATGEKMKTVLRFLYRPRQSMVTVWSLAHPDLTSDAWGDVGDHVRIVGLFLIVSSSENKSFRIDAMTPISREEKFFCPECMELVVRSKLRHHFRGMRKLCQSGSISAIGDDISIEVEGEIERRVLSGIELDLVLENLARTP
ncbi:hypothetical protein BDN72DRAFT_864512 [Pluteus cervinus]|uniref:Uncharacterized protein n=1 Tax=Pluteus cervinus TaxID=181527 RepID=A0ACD3A4E5_9AGAR|nr:hypothetical protein BDN72DRAFT_864512 [Pluteus cervinus]